MKRYKAVVRAKTGKAFPSDPMEQLRGARNAVFRSWNNPRAKSYRAIYEIPDHIGTAVNVQLMVFGNSGDRSATGVGFTRNPANGAKEFYGEFLINAQGEDVVAGIRTPMPITELEKVMPAAYRELRAHTTKLERHYKDVQDFEFTIENEKLFMLQTRNGKRTGYAAVVIATDLVAERLLKPAEALLLVEPSSLSQLLSPVFDPKEWKGIPVATKGLPASPGAASGQIVFTADDAVAWTDQGKKVVLVRKETVPDDIHGMFVSQGVLTATGGMTSHAAVVGRQMGKPAVVGASELRVNEEEKVVHVGGKALHEGDYIAFDGLSGEVKVEKVPTKPSEILQVINGTMAEKDSDIYQRFKKLLEWADKARTMGIRANADLPDQADRVRLRRAGNRAVPDRAHVLRRRPAADRPPDDPRGQRGRPEGRGQRAAAMQRADFYGVFKAMHGCPVTVRTIDPPLHEFLPKREDLMVEVATLQATNGDRKDLEEKKNLLARVEQLHEFNPMLGHRGCRLGITYPEITEMQTRAIMEAACQLNKEGLKVVPEIMIPLVGLVKEFRDQKAIVERVCRGSHEGAGREDQVPGRHDDRGAARRGDRRRDRHGGPVLLVRHERPHADDVRVLPRRRGQVPEDLPGEADPRRRPVRQHRHRRGGQAGGHGVRAGAQEPPRPQARGLRRARGRPGVDSLLPEGRPQLRQLLAVPRAGRQAGGGAGGDGGQGGRLVAGGSGQPRQLAAGSNSVGAGLCAGPTRPLRARKTDCATVSRARFFLSHVMGKIHRLSSELANQIAAGEVVERPASVVKELVENAIDARAGRVSITVELGGKKSIRVEDDGEGMTPEDAELALDRHATSKIASAEDLAAIVTHGFRGEALPSIASVSHFTLTSRTEAALSGTEVRVNGGTLSSVREVAAPLGTAIQVDDLFYNLPARRKFLKSDAAEAAQISRMVTQLALAYPQVGFALSSAGRPVIQCPPVRTLRDRFYQLYGERGDLVEVGKEASGVRVWGLVAALTEQGPKRGPQNIFVNRRIVRDKTIAHAIIDAYSVASVKERSPEVHLFIDMPPDQVDVNVHPTKAEVRFRNQSGVHEVVRRALGAALGQGPAPELQLRAPVVVVPQGGVTQAFPGLLGGVYPSRWGSPGAGAAAWPAPAGGQAASPGGDEPRVEAAGGATPPWTPGDGTVPSDPALSGAMIPLGQFRDTFIIAVDAEGISIIDQHVAHERVLFERVMQRLMDGRLESQLLLEPLVLDMSADACEVLVRRAGELERFGFDVEGFGGRSLRVAAVPALLTPDESIAALRALALDLDGLEKGARVEEALKRIAALTACHAAVKANCPLTHEKMAHILEELRQTAYSSICPHGRPVMLRLTRREVEKNFQRI